MNIETSYLMRVAMIVQLVCLCFYWCFSL